MTTGKEIAEITTPAHRNIASIGGPGIPEIIPQTMDEVWRFAQMVAKSNLLPKGIETPEQVWTQIITGYDLELKPMVAINNIAVINGRPSIGGDLALAIILKSGEMVDHDEWIEGEGDNRVAVCKVERKGMKPIERRFSVQEAKQAGLWQTEENVFKEYWDKNLKQRVKSNFATPNDSPWWRYQSRMLTMRARGFAFRDRFTDVLKGMHLSEEMEGHHEEPRERQISGPSAPPADIMEATTEMPKVEHRQETRPTTSSGPPAPPVEDADIVEGEQRAEERAGDMPHAGYPQDSQREPFDFATWIQEVRDLVATCTTAQAIDDAAEMFSDTAEAELTRPQREEFHEVIGIAHTRLEQALAAGAVDKPEETKPGPAALQDDDEPEQKTEPSPGDLYEAEIEAEINREGVTASSLTDLWNDGRGGKVYRKEILDAGHWTDDRRKALQGKVSAKRAELIEREAGGGEAGGAAEETKPAEGNNDDKAAFTDTLKERLEACTTADEVTALSTETLPHRNAIGDPTHIRLWRTMITKRRDALA